jgi:hypothetical protein
VRWFALTGPFLLDSLRSVPVFGRQVQEGYEMKRQLALALLVAATPGLAQPAPKKRIDPNRMICRTEPILGSRLDLKRRCMTAQQWTDLQRETRMQIDKAQRFEYKGG